MVRASALVFLIGALCRPILESQDEKTDDKGIDIVVVMDLSGSMRAVLDGDPEDVPGAPKLKPGQRLTRLDTAKAVVGDFISRRKTDRIGAIVFGKNAFVLSPLTRDYQLLAQLVSKLTLKVIDDSGTAIGDALMAATARLRKSEAQSKVVILLTEATTMPARSLPRRPPRSPRISTARSSRSRSATGTRSTSKTEPISSATLVTCRSASR